MSAGARLRVRPPAVAGTFYPSESRELAATVDALLDAAPLRDDAHNTARLRALIVPHAGFSYSGPVAATAYALWRANALPCQRVVVIGPAHRAPLRGVAVSSAEAFSTPLGEVVIDAAGRARLLAVPGVVVDDGAHELEHCVEVQLPFVQRVAPRTPVLPLVVGAAPRSLVRAVLDAVWDDTTVLIVSTDLSHYLEYAAAQAADADTAIHIVDADTDAIGDRDACGAYGLRPVLDEASARQFRVTQLDLRSSGDTAGPRDRVVGYGAFTIEADS